MPLRQEFGVFIVNTFLFLLVPGVLLIPPSHAGLDLFPTDIPTVDIDDADPPPVAVDLPAIGLRLPVVRQGGEMGLRFFAERLSLLGGYTQVPA